MISSRRLEFVMSEVFRRSVIRLVFTIGALVLGVDVPGKEAWAESGKIYVIREKSGVVRFTTKPPADGVKANVFTAKSSSFSTFSYSTRGSFSGKIFPDRYNEVIHHAAKEHRVDPGLIKAVIHVESAFNPSARSPKGAQGLMQLMPGTARDLGVNAWHPTSNILGGTRYLARLLKKFDGNVQHALAAYNAGEENVTKYNGIPPFAETQHYVKRVLQLKRRYSATARG